MSQCHAAASGDPSYTTIAALVQKWAKTDPDTPAFIFRSPSWRLTLSRADVFRQAARCAAILRKMGVRQGDIVANTLPNSPERLLTDIGIVLAGGTAMNGQVFLKDGEDLVGSIRDAGCVGIVLDPLQLQGAASLLRDRQHVVGKDGIIRYPEMPGLKIRLECCQKSDGKRKSFLEVLEEDGETYVCESTKPEDTAVVWTTSGSTGFSKLVPLSHHKVLLSSHYFYTFLGLTPADMYYNDGPLGWAGGFIKAYLTHGATRVMVDFSREAVDDHFAFVWKVVMEERVTVMYMAPYYIEKLVEHHLKMKAADSGQKETELQVEDGGNKHTWISESRAAASQGEAGHNTSGYPAVGASRFSDNQTTNPGPATKYRLRILCCGGQPLKKPHLAALGTITEAIRICYGATETGLMAWRHVDDAAQYESCNNGLPVPGMQLKIVDDTEEEVGVGEMGEIIVKSDQGFLGYLNNDASTEKTFTPDRWIRTGDVGYRNSQGEVHVLCRKSNSIIRGTILVYPGWLETPLTRYPGVQNVMVVPVPDPVFHQELCACVVTLPGAQVTAEGLREFCRGLFLTEECDHITAVPNSCNLSVMSTSPNSNAIARTLEMWADIHPEAPAFIFVDLFWNRAVLSRDELFRLSGNCSALLDLTGVKPGDVVCNTLPNNRERLLTELGIILAGATALDGREVLDNDQDFYQFLKDSACNGLLYDPRGDQDVVELLSEEMYAVQENGLRHYANFPHLKLVMECYLKSGGEHRTLMEMLQDETLHPYVFNPLVPGATGTVRVKDRAACVWSGADTSDGVPRMVPRSQSQLLALGKSLRQFLSLQTSDVYYTDHAFGSVWGFIGPYLHCGATRVLADHSCPLVVDDGVFFYEVVHRERCTVAFLDRRQGLALARHINKSRQANGVSETHRPLVDRGNENIVAGKKQVDVTAEWKLRVIAFETYPVRNSHLVALSSIAKAIHGAYGSPETGIMCWRIVETASSHNVGRPAPGVQVDIVPGKSSLGEVMVKSKQTFTGYFRDLRDHASKSDLIDTCMVVTQEGRVRTGDVGYFTKDGHLCVLCHKRNAIVRGTIKIYPGWLETKLSRYPGIRQVVIVPVPNASKAWHEVCACVILEKRAKVTREELFLVCTGLYKTPEGPLHMAVPEHFFFLQFFPTTPDGRVSRRVLTTVARQSHS